MPAAVRTVLLVALLALGQSQAIQAGLNIFWRLAVLSFDRPATQHADELASLSVPGADVRREASAAVTTAARVARGLVPRAAVVRLDESAVLPAPSRAPPVT